MKILLLLILALPAYGQDFATKFNEAQARAPKGYPTLFVVTSASETPAILGGNKQCGMTIDTLGRRLLVVGGASWTEPCKAFQPGTALFGNVHKQLATIVDLVDPRDEVAGKKLKSHRYTIENVTLLDPATQQ